VPPELKCDSLKGKHIEGSLPNTTCFIALVGSAGNG